MLYSEWVILKELVDSRLQELEIAKRTVNQDKRKIRELDDLIKYNQDIIKYLITLRPYWSKQ